MAPACSTYVSGSSVPGYERPFVACGKPAKWKYVSAYDGETYFACTEDLTLDVGEVATLVEDGTA